MFPHPRRAVVRSGCPLFDANELMRVSEIQDTVVFLLLVCDVQRLAQRQATVIQSGLEIVFPTCCGAPPVVYLGIEEGR